MIKKSILRNEKGSLIINSLGVLFFLGLATTYMMKNASDTLRNIRIPRIKAAQTTIESALRHVLVQPASFLNAAGDDTCNTDVGYTSCQLNPAVINSLFEPIVGCLTPVPCGVRVVASGPNAWSYDSATRTFTGRIIYEGTDLRQIKPHDVSIVVPAEVLQSEIVRCTSVTTPLLAGFMPDGTKRCIAVGAPAVCPGGQYAAGFNNANLSLECRSIQSTPVSCPANQMIGSFNFQNPANISFTCINRPPPTTLWGAPPF